MIAWKAPGRRLRTIGLFTGRPKTAQHLHVDFCARERQPGQGALAAAGSPLLGGDALLGGRRFLAKLELRVREDIELERKASVLVQKGDSGSVPVALVLGAFLDDVGWRDGTLRVRIPRDLEYGVRRRLRDTRQPGFTRGESIALLACGSL